MNHIVTVSYTHLHGNCIGGKFYLKSGVEIIDRFDQADAADLKKVIRIFTAVLKTPDHA